MAIAHAMTPDVEKAIRTLRSKGYGWGVLANTASDALGIKVSANYLKDKYGSEQPSQAPLTTKINHETQVKKQTRALDI